MLPRNYMPSEAPTPLRAAEIHVFKQNRFFRIFGDRSKTIVWLWRHRSPEKTEFSLNSKWKQCTLVICRWLQFGPKISPRCWDRSTFVTCKNRFFSLFELFYFSTARRSEAPVSRIGRQRLKAYTHQSKGSTVLVPGIRDEKSEKWLSKNFVRWLSLSFLHFFRAA